MPGVKAAVPSIQKFSALWHEKNHVRLLVMGIDPAQDEAVRDYDVGRKGRPSSEKYDALLETGFARGLGVQRGRGSEFGRLARTLHGSIKKFKITGLLSPQGAAGFNQGGVIFLPLKTAESLFSKAGNVNLISVVLAEGGRRKADGGRNRQGLADRRFRPLAHGPLPTGQRNGPGRGERA